jgi:hypothetical protein
MAEICLPLRLSQFLKGRKYWLLVIRADCEKQRLPNLTSLPYLYYY